MYASRIRSGQNGLNSRDPILHGCEHIKSESLDCRNEPIDKRKRHPLMISLHSLYLVTTIQSLAAT
jgi:hypothetical protein